MPIEYLDELPRRPIWQAMRKGFAMRCPDCGHGRLFGRYTKVLPACPSCGLDYSHQRADDAPAYFTILIVGHLVVGSLVTVEKIAHPPVWLHMLIWIPLCIALSLVLLPRVKGALIGLQWANRMHGFGGPEPEVEPWG